MPERSRPQRMRTAMRALLPPRSKRFRGYSGACASGAFPLLGLLVRLVGGAQRRGASVERGVFTALKCL